MATEPAGEEQLDSDLSAILAGLLPVAPSLRSVGMLGTWCLLFLWLFLLSLLGLMCEISKNARSRMLQGPQCFHGSYSDDLKQANVRRSIVSNEIIKRQTYHCLLGICPRQRQGVSKLTLSLSLKMWKHYITMLMSKSMLYCKVLVNCRDFLYQCQRSTQDLGFRHKTSA